MSEVARWAYTAKATIWHVIGKERDGTKLFAEPIAIDCDYKLGSGANAGAVGLEFVVKDSYFTEYDKAQKGDFIKLGEITELNPITAKADEIRSISQFADTFNREADDFLLMTSV